MTDRIKLIKQEIKKLKQTNGFLPVDNHEICDAYRARGYQFACDDILQFIDSLQEGSNVKSEDFSNECSCCGWSLDSERLKEILKKKMNFFYPPIDDYNEGKLAVLKDLYQELFNEYYI